MNAKNTVISLKLIILASFLSAHPIFAQSDCKAPCIYFDWRRFCTVTKAAPVVTIMPPIQEYLIYDIRNLGIICPDSNPPATPPKKESNYGTVKKETQQYSIETGAKWETFGLTEQVAGQKTFSEIKEVKAEVIGYCRHESADIAKSEKILTVKVTEKCPLWTTEREETLHSYSLFYRSPADPQSPDDPNCRTRCDVLF